MTTRKTSQELRVFGIDIGVVNMGMASIVIGEDGVGRIEKLDWQSLFPSGKGITIGSIIEATGRYIDSIMTRDPLDPSFDSGGPRIPAPNIIVIEQQHVSFTHGINMHALEIQASLLSRFSERFPTTTLKSVAASARRSKKLGFDTKERAMTIGAALALPADPYWSRYALGLKDPQHTYDALTMAVDSIDFRGFPEVKSRISEWEATAVPTPSKKRSGKK